MSGVVVVEVEEGRKVERVRISRRALGTSHWWFARGRRKKVRAALAKTGPVWEGVTRKVPTQRQSRNLASSGACEVRTKAWADVSTIL